ncbi:MAG: glycosyltransferase family 2 protein [Schleiferiaceae bacterium]
MRLSVLIVNYNVKSFLDQCLRSVRSAARGLDVEVIVVDNASTDGSGDWIPAQFPEVRWIASPSNLGFGRANNLALGEATGDVVLYLNPDTVVPEDNFTTALAYLTAHPEVGSLGCRMIDGTGAFLPESKRALPTPSVALYRLLGLSALAPRSPRFARYYLGHLPEDQNAEVDVHCGAWMMVRKPILDQLGGFDEAFFMYGEDIDLSYRIQQAGWQNHYLATSPIIHYKGESTKHATWKYVRTFHEAMDIFARKHFAGRAAAFSALIRLGIYAKASASMLQRWATLVLPLIVELGLGLFLAEAMTGYWERSHRYVEGGAYPAIYREWVLPAYALVWFGTYHILGGARGALRRWFTSGLLATLALLVGYGLLPLELRFSRALVLLSSLLFAVASLGIRALRLAGALRERGLLRSGTAHFGRTGTPVSPSENPIDYDLPWNDHRLAALLTFQPSVVALHPGSDLSFSDCIQLMLQLRGQGIRFRTVYPEWSLGSDDRRFSSDVSIPELDKPAVRRSRRVLHLGIALLLIALLPLALCTRRGRFYVKHLLPVLRGTRSWVGYAGDGIGLSPIPPGIVPHVPPSGVPEWDREADRRYAMRWHVDLDVYALLRRHPVP